MAKQVINTGTAANSRDGDSLRSSFTKINANFTELYDTLVGRAGTDVFVLKRVTTSNAAAILTQDGNTPSSLNQIVLPNNSLYAFTGTMVCRNNSSTNDMSAWAFEGAIARGVNAASTRIVGTPTIRVIATDGSAYTFTLTADTTNGGLAIAATGAAATTLNWLCTVTVTHV